MGNPTKAPWRAVRNGPLGDCWVEYGEDGRTVCAINYGGTEGWANACLIAAALDLLEAARGAVECFGHIADYYGVETESIPAVVNLRAAIDKAGDPTIGADTREEEADG